MSWEECDFVIAVFVHFFGYVGKVHGECDDDVFCNNYVMSEVGIHFE